jgi:hypothetical protein
MAFVRRNILGHGHRKPVLQVDRGEAQTVLWFTPLPGRVLPKHTGSTWVFGVPCIY